MLTDFGIWIGAAPLPLDFPAALEDIFLIALSMRAPKELSANVGGTTAMLEAMGEWVTIHESEAHHGSPELDMDGIEKSVPSGRRLAGTGQGGHKRGEQGPKLEATMCG